MKAIYTFVVVLMLSLDLSQATRLYSSVKHEKTLEPMKWDFEYDVVAPAKGEHFFNEY